jgi:hypothetical protein
MSDPWQSREYAEEFKSRHGKYPGTYKPAPEPEAVESFDLEETYRSMMDEYSTDRPTEPEPTAADAVESAVGAAKKKRKYTKREDIQYLKPFSDKFKYGKILDHFRDNLTWSWPEIAILSEMDVVMIDSEGACYAGHDHYAKIGRVSHGTARNILSKLMAQGAITELGYHAGLSTKNRVVSPKFSSDPELSKRIIQKYRR